MHQPSSLAAQCCPLCGQPNACALEAQRGSGGAQPPCWCTELKFSADLLAKIPAQARGRACLCRACASGMSAA